MRCPRQLHQNLLPHLLNSIWLQFTRSAWDQSNRRINTFTASPAWAWPMPRRRWTSPIVDIARTCRPACSGPAAIWFAAYSGWGSLPLLRRTFQQQTTRSRSSSAPGSSQRRDIPRPAPAVGTATAPRQEPDVRRKAWGPGRKRHGQQRSPRHDSRSPPAAKPPS